MHGSADGWWPPSVARPGATAFQEIAQANQLAYVGVIGTASNVTFAAVVDNSDDAGSGASDAVFAHSNDREAGKIWAKPRAHSPSLRATPGHHRRLLIQLIGSLGNTRQRGAML